MPTLPETEAVGCGERTELNRTILERMFLNRLVNVYAGECEVSPPPPPTRASILVLLASACGDGRPSASDLWPIVINSAGVSSSRHPSPKAARS